MNLKQHIAGGPYTYDDRFDIVRQGDGGFLVRTDECGFESVERIVFALNFPASVLEVLREEYKKWYDGFIETSGVPYGVACDAIILCAEALGFSREEVTDA